MFGRNSYEWHIKLLWLSYWHDSPKGVSDCFVFHNSWHPVYFIASLPALSWFNYIPSNDIITDLLLQAFCQKQGGFTLYITIEETCKYEKSERKSKSTLEWKREGCFTIHHHTRWWNSAIYIIMVCTNVFVQVLLFRLLLWAWNNC